MNKNDLLILEKYFNISLISNGFRGFNDIRLSDETLSDIKITMKSFNIPLEHFEVVKNIFKIIKHADFLSHFPAYQDREDIFNKERDLLREYFDDEADGKFKIEKINFIGIDDKGIPHNLSITTHLLILEICDCWVLTDFQLFGFQETHKIKLKPGPKKIPLQEYFEKIIKRINAYLSVENIIKTQTARNQFIADLFDLADLKNFNTVGKIRGVFNSK